MNKYRIEIFATTNRQWCWRMRAANGNILATSESYSKRQDAAKVARALVEAVKKGGPIEIVEVLPER